MTGGFTARAEIIGGIDQAASEMMLPDPIDHHACGEGVGRTRQPSCELQSPAAGIGGQGLPAEDLRKATGGKVATRLGIAALVNLRVVWLTLDHGVSFFQPQVEFLAAFDRVQVSDRELLTLGQFSSDP